MARREPTGFILNHSLGLVGARTRLSEIINIVIPKTHLVISKKAWKKDERYYEFSGTRPCEVTIGISKRRLNVSAVSDSPIIQKSVVEGLRMYIKTGMRKRQKKK